MLFGVTAAVVLDSFIHVSGPPLSATTAATTVPLELVIEKFLFYTMVLLGTVLPDIDNPFSLVGRRAGWISKEIQHVAGHRTVFHSLIGLATGVLLALAIEQLVIVLLAKHGFIPSALFVGTSHLVIVAISIGCLTHLFADGLTEGGIPLFWPCHTRFGFPPDRHWRFRTGHWQEYVVVYGLMLLVAFCVWQAILTI